MLTDTDPNTYAVLSSHDYESMIAYLIKNSLAYVPVIGGYLMQSTGEFVTENSVIVQADTVNKLIILGFLDNQESVLILSNKDKHNRYNSTLWFKETNHFENIGWLVQATEKEALRSEHGYTYRPDTDQYFIVMPYDYEVQYA